MGSLTYNKFGIVRINNPKEMPTANHYAILVFDTKSVWVPGDERSRTNPGHGYPEHTDTYETFEYWATNSLDTLKQGIALLEQGKDVPKYTVLQATPLSVSTEIKVEVNVG